MSIIKKYWLLQTNRDDKQNLPFHIFHNSVFNRQPLIVILLVRMSLYFHFISQTNSNAGVVQDR